MRAVRNILGVLLVLNLLNIMPLYSSSVVPQTGHIGAYNISDFLLYEQRPAPDKYGNSRQYIGLGRSMTTNAQNPLYATYRYQYESSYCPTCIVIIYHFLRERDSKKVLWQNCRNVGSGNTARSWYRLNTGKITLPNKTMVYEYGIARILSYNCVTHNYWGGDMAVLGTITAYGEEKRTLNHTIDHKHSIRFLGLNGPKHGRIVYRYNNVIQPSKTKLFKKTSTIPMITTFSEYSSTTHTFAPGPIPTVQYRIEFSYDDSTTPSNWKRLGDWTTIDTTGNPITINESNVKILFSDHQLHDITN